MRPESKIGLAGVSLACDGLPILHDITLEFAGNCITAVVGPSGSGKSSLLLTMNRLWEEIPGCEVRGVVTMRVVGRVRDIRTELAADELRRRVGTVFQTPNPLPMSILRNLALPLRLAGERGLEKIRAVAEEYLRLTGLWDEVRERLGNSALSLSGGQQQRLCLARALMLRPEILLLDEPTSSLDRRSAGIVEDLLSHLKNRCTIVLVSHHNDQVRRIADHVVELADGRIV